jgi:hypothetical protein
LRPRREIDYLPLQTAQRVRYADVGSFSGCPVHAVRLTAQPGVLILDITEQHPDGHRAERRLVLEKQ